MPDQPRLDTFKATSPSGTHQVAFADWGDPTAKRTVICCHGLTRNGRDFDALARRLAKDGYRVICPDVVGRGRSDWLTDPALYGYAQYIADMSALIAARNIAPVEWIGTSMGGLIGMFLAASPERPVRTLVMNDVGPFLPRAAVERIAGYVGADLRLESIAAVEAYLRQVHAPFGPLTDAQWAHLATHGHRRRADGSYGLAYDPAIGAKLKEAVKDWDFREVWDKITCPTLVLRGALSDLLSADLAAEMTGRGPKADLVTFDGVGHAPALVAEDQIETIRRWLARQN
jgi:pimeloyl-ACP methyl ester carboxylesterase